VLKPTLTCRQVHEAARWSNPESVQLLLSAGADTSIRNNHGDTPLIKYAYEMSGFCLNYHHLDGRGTNPRLETFKLVMQSTVGVNAKNDRGDTALHALANGRLSGHMAQGRMEAAKSLIEKGADVSSRNGDAKTAGDLFIQNDTGLLLQKDAFLVQLLAGTNTK